MGSMMRPVTLAFVVAALAGCGSNPQDPAEAAISRAAGFLWSKQGADGGWHSDTYGLMRSGQSLTPFVLLALLEVPESVAPRPSGAADRAVAFIRGHLDHDGALGRMDPSLDDYPNYATALAVRALMKAGHREEVGRMVACLKRQQFGDENGWPPDHPAYGAWGMGGPVRKPPHTGHLDLSMTRHVLEALAAAGVPRDDPAFVRAGVFLRRCQNPDGGFIFSTVVVDANKAGRDGDRYRSYGTATGDGLLCLRALGAADDDPRVASARNWLRLHHRVDRVPGLAGDPAEGMKHYYLAVASRVMPELRKEIAGALRSGQRPDGSWTSANFYMKEDDPLIATPLALRALIADRP